MRAKPILAILALAGLVLAALPGDAAARRLVVLGSLKVEKVVAAVPEPLVPGEVTGLAVILNPGLEKTMAQQLPPYMIPVFVDEDNGGPNLDTLLAVTNTTDAGIVVRLTVYGQDGGLLGSRDVPLGPRATTSLFVSSLIP